MLKINFIKKSYDARRLLDVLLNVDFIFLHLNKYHENYLRLKKI